jgi:hypothetical protein
MARKLIFLTNDSSEDSGDAAARAIWEAVQASQRVEDPPPPVVIEADEPEP